MRLQVVIATFLAGCAVEPAAEAGQLRQAALTFPSFPQYRGLTPGAQLGASVAACRGQGFVAGAPGSGATLLVSTLGGNWFADPGTSGDGGAVGRAVACDGLSGSVVASTAGVEGAFAFDQPGTRLTSLPVASLARAPLEGLPLLVGVPSRGQVLAFTLTSAGYDTQSTLVGATGVGATLQWHDTGALFLAGNPALGSVVGYAWTDGGAQLQGSISGPLSWSFGAALAIGDVHPNPGVEVIVGAPQASKVLIYTPGGVLLMTLDGTSGTTGFGSSLAIEPAPAVASTLRALWVGEPSLDRVYRFIGDAGTALSPPFAGGSAFGASLAVSGQELVVGAPHYSDSETDQGAVFTAPFNTVPISAVPMVCTVGTPCSTAACTVGQCLGGVACQGPFSSLNCVFGCLNGVCLNSDGGIDRDAGVDAGEPDAGERDAGAFDAGARDAGEGDAGSRDSGFVSDGGASDGGPPGPDVVHFTTCGCSGAGALPVLLLALLQARRRKSAPFESDSP